MSSPTHLVTGATDGIGFQTALELARLGNQVLVHGRSEEKAKAACERLRGELKTGQFVPVYGDFGRLEQVRQLATQVSELDVLVNNAGVFAETRTVTADGHETTLQVNHLAPFLLTHLLRPLL